MFNIHQEIAQELKHIILLFMCSWNAQDSHTISKTIFYASSIPFNTKLKDFNTII